MILLNVGCGGNTLPGFINTDSELDIRQPLPYGDNTVTAIHAEHVVEHVTIHEAYNFMIDCRRVLVPGGVLRMSVPSAEKIYSFATPEYLAFLQRHGWGDGSMESAIRSILFNHGHMAAWTQNLLLCILRSLGFYANPVLRGQSEFPFLRGVEGHYKVIGAEFDDLESVRVEAVK